MYISRNKGKLVNLSVSLSPCLLLKYFNLVHIFHVQLKLKKYWELDDFHDLILTFRNTCVAIPKGGWIAGWEVVESYGTTENV